MTTNTNPAEPIIETIDIIEEVFDSKMALGMLALGAVVGAVIYILWQESKKGNSLNNIVKIPVAPAPEIEYVDDDSEDDD